MVFIPISVEWFCDYKCLCCLLFTNKYFICYIQDNSAVDFAKKK